MPQFKSKEDCEAVAELLQGLCENRLVCFEKKERHYGATIAGQLILDVFKVPNRSYHLEDIQAELEESHFAASTVASYMPRLVDEGYIKVLGPQTYIRINDTTPAVCPDDRLAPSVDGDVARLEQSQAGGCGCGDT
jgi:hypothetical protein